MPVCSAAYGSAVLVRSENGAQCAQGDVNGKHIHIVFNSGAVAAIQEVAFGLGVLLGEGGKAMKVPASQAAGPRHLESLETIFPVQDKVDLVARTRSPEVDVIRFLERIHCGAKFLMHQDLERLPIDVGIGVKWPLRSQRTKDASVKEGELWVSDGGSTSALGETSAQSTLICRFRGGQRERSSSWEA